MPNCELGGTDYIFFQPHGMEGVLQGLVWNCLVRLPLLCPLQVAPPSFTSPICKYARLHMLIRLIISCTMTVPDSVDAVNVYRSCNLVQAVKVDSAHIDNTSAFKCR